MVAQRSEPASMELAILGCRNVNVCWVALVCFQIAVNVVAALG